MTPKKQTGEILYRQCLLINPVHKLMIEICLKQNLVIRDIDVNPLHLQNGRFFNYSFNIHAHIYILQLVSNK